jgi:CheY-like chemotaxis protein
MARVMFVDDDPMTLETLSRAVEMLGHHAILAATGAQALDLARREAPDMIFIDLNLPDMDGSDLSAALQADHGTSAIPRLIHSAGSETELRQAVVASGAVAYLAKPVRLQILLDTIQKYARVPKP